MSVGFSPDCQLIVSGSWNSTIQVWDVHRGKQVAGPLRGHISGVKSVRFSPDGKLIVSGSWDSTIRVWDTYSFNLNVAPLTEYLPSHLSLVPQSHYNLIFALPEQLLPFSLSSIPYTNSSQMDDGWILGPNNELLFWIPPAYHTNLWRHSNTLLVGPIPLRVDFTQFFHGLDWHRCYVPTVP